MLNTNHNAAVDSTKK